MLICALCATQVLALSLLQDGNLSKGQMLSKEHLLLCKVMLTTSIPAAQVSTNSRVVEHRVLLRQGQMSGPLLFFVM